MVQRDLRGATGSLSEFWVSKMDVQGAKKTRRRFKGVLRKLRYKGA